MKLSEDRRGCDERSQTGQVVGATAAGTKGPWGQGCSKQREGQEWRDQVGPRSKVTLQVTPQGRGLGPHWRWQSQRLDPSRGPVSSDTTQLSLQSPQQTMKIPQRSEAREDEEGGVREEGEGRSREMDR